MFYVKKNFSEEIFFCEEPDSLQKKFLLENILCQEKNILMKIFFCEEPDSLQTKFLAENILCQEKKYSEENIFLKSQTHCNRKS